MSVFAQIGASLIKLSDINYRENGIISRGRSSFCSRVKKGDSESGNMELRFLSLSFLCRYVMPGIFLQI